MTPTHDHHADRDDAPTAREIAALTARLRDLSWRGADVDPAERAAFLADKDALIARITATQQDDASGARVAPRSHAVPPERLADVEMPDWMREQARRAEAAIAAGTAPARADDPAEITARMEALREEIATRDAETPTVWECERPVGRPPCCVVIDAEQQEARREQLARWHTDDTVHEDGATCERRDGWDDGPGLP